MLRKDNENITKNIREQFQKELSFINPRTRTVVFKLTNAIFNGKDRKPRSYHIETSYVSRDDSGNTSEFIYYKSENNKNIGGVIQKVFSPEFVAFSERGDFIVNIGENQNENLDLLLFFLNHPRLAKSRSGDGTKRSIFYLEDKNKEAADKVAFKEDQARMDAYLYNPDTRLSDEKLKTIAMALRVPGVEDMNTQRIQTSIEEKCKKNPSLFLGMAEVNSDVLMRSNIQKATEKSILQYDTLKQQWMLNDKDSGEKAELVKVRKLEDQTNSLVYWFNNVDTNDHYGKVVELLTGTPTKRATGSTMVESELDKKLKLKQEENETLRLQIELAKAQGSPEGPKSEGLVVKSALSSLEAMSLEELKQLADSRGLKYHHMTKEAKMIKLIKNAEEAATV